MTVLWTTYLPDNTGLIITKIISILENIIHHLVKELQTLGRYFKITLLVTEWQFK